jgi:hypothetical protein
MFEQHEQQSCTDDFKLSLATLTNNPHFVQLRQSRNKPLSSTQTEIILTDIHPAHVLIDASTSTPGIFRQHASGIGPYRASHTDDGNPDAGIGGLLNTLHTYYPGIGYAQHKKRLKSLGICYLDVASMFSPNFYIRNVGMTTGAAHLFCKWIAKARQARQRQTRQIRRRAHMAVDEGGNESMAQ